MSNEFRQEFEEINKNFMLGGYPSPLEKININDTEVYLKRDDKLKLGCSKQRSISYLMDYYLSNGISKFTVASSGNAALVACYIALKSDKVKHLHVMLSNQISTHKLSKFIKYLEMDIDLECLTTGCDFKNITFELSNNPKQKSFLLEKNGFTNLRGSVDDNALLGFKTISLELKEQIQNIDAIFVPSSSGSTVMGIYEGFKELGLKLPEFHIVQTTKVFTLIKRLERPEKIESMHPAESIVDMVGHRRKQIEELIHESNGCGCIISSKEVLEASKELKEIHNIETSCDSVLSYAAYKKCIKTKKYKNPVLLFTGI